MEEPLIIYLAGAIFRNSSSGRMSGAVSAACTGIPREGLTAL